MIPESNSLFSWLPEPLSFYLSIDLSFTKLTIKCTLYSIKGSVKKRASTLSIKNRDPIVLRINYSTKHKLLPSRRSTSLLFKDIKYQCPELL
jgi:hypothetical protein